MKRLVVMLAAVVIASSPSCLFAQATDGNLVGSVTDATGALIQNADLELQNIDTGVQYTAKTDDAGQYRFNNVPVGAYKLTAKASGFTPTTVQNIRIELNRTTTVNATVQLGQVSSSVTIVDAAATIDTTTARVSTTFNTRDAVQLPTTGTGTLGVINLSLLGAGVTSSGGAGYGTGPSVGGQRPTNNNFMIDGVDNNNRSVTGPVINVSNEAVAEFSLQQNQFSPEFGHSTGGQFNTSVRSGTNEVHGSLYEYFQNRNLNAIDESFKRQGIKKNPRNDQNRLGATIGGPIVKNKWFYFGNMEYLPIGQASSSSSILYVPTAEGIATLGSMANVNKANLDVFKAQVPVAGTAAAGKFAKVNGTNIPLGVLSVTGPSYENQYRAVVSSDYNFSEKDQLRARWIYFKDDTTDVVPNLPQFFTPVQIRAHVASLTEIHSFSPSLTNELRVGYTRRIDDRPIGNYTFPGLDVFPNLSFADLAGLSIGPNGNYPQSSRYNTIQLVDNINWTVGRHTFKFGYDGRKVNATNFFVQRQRGDYQYNTLERYLLDLTPEFAERSVGGFPFVGNLLSHYAFVNDDFRMRSNLTINLGLRYEFVGVPVGAQAQALNALASVPGVLEFKSPKPTYLDFAPRVGVAYSPGSSGRTSIRAGFGMGYDQIYQNLGTNSLPPEFFTTIDAHVDRPGQPNFLAGGGISPIAAPITNPATARRLTSSYIPDQIRPYSLEWNFGVQHVFASDFTFESRYLGTKGVHLPYQVQINRQAMIHGPQQSLPVFLQKPSQADLDALAVSLESLSKGFNSNTLAAYGFGSSITAFTPQGNSHYHGWANQLTKRFSHGLQFIGAYTWSHAIDDSTATLNSTVTSPRRPQDFQNLSIEKASSALDRRHRFTFAGVYDAPWLKNSNWFAKNIVGNWTISGAYTAESGEYATVRSNVDANNNGDNASDRAWINAAGDPNRGSDMTALKNTAGQTVGYLVVDPTARYVVARPGVWANGGRNTLKLPGINNLDASLAKKFNVTESKFVEFRGEFYNLPNHPQYVPGYPGVANLRSRTTGGASTFLIPNNPIFNRPDLAYQSNSRVIQLVLRLQF